MTTVFGQEYAAAYDALYAEKDYDAECDLVQRVFGQYAVLPVRRVLDLGCGTGGHAVLLARRGLDVTGVDRSPAMLARASERRSTARFVLGDLTTLDLGETFDAAIMMFAVLGYQAGNADVAAALATARRHLRPGGLLFFDVWYGPAVLRQGPSDRVRVIAVPAGQVIRAATAELDSRYQHCTVRYRVWRIENGRLAGETTEHHQMRFFFPLELEGMLTTAGFDLARLGAFPALDAEPDESTWNVGVVARAT